MSTLRVVPRPCQALVTTVLAVCMAGGCATHPTANFATALTNGFSGMAMIDESHYLAVHDALSHEDGARISIVAVTAEQDAVVTPVSPATWQDREGRSSDLESVCALPDRDGEFLLVEAGHWNGDFGRMFHAKVDISKVPYQIRILTAFELPEFDPKGPGDRDGDEIEGLACAARRDGSVLVILGERGGSSTYTAGLLRWFVINPDAQDAVRWSPAGRAGVSVNAPGPWSHPDENRDVSDLYLDSDNMLWAAAAEDPGDTGPFKSVIYRVGEVRADDPEPVRLANPVVVSKHIEGFKVESLAAPTPNIPGSVFAIGTEDEALGGVWRALR